MRVHICSNSESIVMDFISPLSPTSPAPKQMILVPLNQTAHTCQSSFPLSSKGSAFVPPKPNSLVNTVLYMDSKDPERLQYLSSLSAQKTTSVLIAPGQQVLNSHYMVRVKLGTPGQVMFMVLDTSNDAVCWGTMLQVLGHHICAQYLFDLWIDGLSPGPVYSSPRVLVPYGGDSSFSAFLVKDALTLGKDVVQDYAAFGCIDSVPMENSFIHSSYGSLACLAIAAAQISVKPVLNVISNLQQRNQRILFDGGQFSVANCQ